jgi:hypothetical protein
VGDGRKERADHSSIAAHWAQIIYLQGNMAGDNFRLFPD